MTDALFNAQSAVYAALAASPAVQALIGDPSRIYDHVPPGAVFPYMTFSSLHIVPYDAKIETGFTQLLTLDIWSRYRGSKEAKDILQAAYDALHRATLPVAGEVFLLCELHSADVTPLDDGLTTQATLRLAITTQSELKKDFDMAKLHSVDRAAALYAAQATRELNSLRQSLRSAEDNLQGLTRRLRTSTPHGGSRYIKGSRTSTSPLFRAEINQIGSSVGGLLSSEAGLAANSFYTSSAQSLGDLFGLSRSVERIS